MASWHGRNSDHGFDVQHRPDQRQELLKIEHALVPDTDSNGTVRRGSRHIATPSVDVKTDWTRGEHGRILNLRGVRYETRTMTFYQDDEHTRVGSVEVRYHGGMIREPVSVVLGEELDGGITQFTTIRHGQVVAYDRRDATGQSVLSDEQREACLRIHNDGYSVAGDAAVEFAQAYGVNDLVAQTT